MSFTHLKIFRKTLQGRITEETEEEEYRMLRSKQKTLADKAAHIVKDFTALQETELVLKLKKEELFDPHVLLPHAELNSIVYRSVDAFTEKYKGTDMTLLIYTEPVNEMIQDSFREVYRSHYREEFLKVQRYLKRYYIRSLALIPVSLIALLLGMSLTADTILSYVILNIGAFCLWEIGYTQFTTHDAVDEKKRITRAMNAGIEFH